LGVQSKEDINNSSIYFKHFKILTANLLRVRKYSKGIMIPCKAIYSTEIRMETAENRKGRAATQLQN
jgi:hypothetical protein